MKNVAMRESSPEGRKAMEEFTQYHRPHQAMANVGGMMRPGRLEQVR